MPIFNNTDDAMIGLLAGITTVMEMFVGEKVLQNKQLVRLLKKQRDEFVNKKQPDSATMVELMLRPLRDLQRAADRRLLNEPPHGQG